MTQYNNSDFLLIENLTEEINFYNITNELIIECNLK